MPKTRRADPEQFRREALQLVRQGRSIPDVAESLGVSQQTLRTGAVRAGVTAVSAMTGCLALSARSCASSEGACGAWSRSATFSSTRRPSSRVRRDPVSVYRHISDAKQAKELCTTFGCAQPRRQQQPDPTKSGEVHGTCPRYR